MDGPWRGDGLGANDLMKAELVLGGGRVPRGHLLAELTHHSPFRMAVRMLDVERGNAGGHSAFQTAAFQQDGARPEAPHEPLKGLCHPATLPQGRGLKEIF